MGANASGRMPNASIRRPAAVFGELSELTCPLLVLRDPVRVTTPVRNFLGQFPGWFGKRRSHLVRAEGRSAFGHELRHQLSVGLGRRAAVGIA